MELNISATVWTRKMHFASLIFLKELYKLARIVILLFQSHWLKNERPNNITIYYFYIGLVTIFFIIGYCNKNNYYIMHYFFYEIKNLLKTIKKLNLRQINIQIDSYQNIHLIRKKKEENYWNNASAKYFYNVKEIKPYSLPLYST